MHYNWHRHYDASIGRYTQPDPLGFVDGPSVYAYARNNPQMFVDEDGRFVFFFNLEGTVIAGGGQSDGKGGVINSGGTAGAGLATDFDTSAAFASYGPGFGLELSAGATAGILFGDLCDFAGESRTIVLGPITFIYTAGGKFGISLTASLGTGVSYQNPKTETTGPFLDKCKCRKAPDPPYPTITIP